EARPPAGRAGDAGHGPRVDVGQRGTARPRGHLGLRHDLPAGVGRGLRRPFLGGGRCHQRRSGARQRPELGRAHRARRGRSARPGRSGRLRRRRRSPGEPRALRPAGPRRRQGTVRSRRPSGACRGLHRDDGTRTVGRTGTRVRPRRRAEDRRPRAAPVRRCCDAALPAPPTRVDDERRLRRRWDTRRAVRLRTHPGRRL
ncbi:MAG: Phage tail fiber protein, partial [uncultured Frankineae bacterium]